MKRNETGFCMHSDEKTVRLDRIRFKTLYDLSRMMDRPEQEILDFALEAGVRATDSDIGYIYFASSDETELYLHAWSKNVMPQCSVNSYPDAYLVSETGLWGEAMRQRKPVITNDYDSSPYKKGYPEGHVPVKNHMNLPVIDNGKVVIIAGVGNKPAGYTREDVQQLSLIMDGMWNIVKRKRVELELKQNYENLEKIIQERTEELQTANTELHRIIEKQQRTEAVLTRSESLFRGVFDNASAAIMVLSPEGNVTLGNRVCAKLLGYSQQELLSKNLTELVHPDELKGALDNLQTNIKKGFNTWHNERKLITKTGQIIWGNINLTLLKDDKDNIESMIIIATDITARVNAEQALLQSSLELERSREQLQIIIDSVPALISYIDTGLRYRFANKHYQMMFGTNPEKLIGKHVETVIGKATYKKVKHRYEAVLRGEPQRYEMDYSNRGRSYTLDVAYIPHQHEGQVEGIFLMVMDVTEQKKLEKHLELLSITDPLTGAKNRRYFMDQTQKEIDRAKRYNSSLSLIMIDIDHFKSINDTYGHGTGDHVLKKMVEVSGAILRASDVFSRIGGEEFAVTLIETDIEKAESIAERLRELLAGVRIPAGENEIKFTISIGITQFNRGEDTLDKMIKRADDALYEAKNTGRNRTVTYL